MIIRVFIISLLICFALFSCSKNSTVGFEQKIIANSKIENPELNGFPKAQGIVTDLENILTTQEKHDLSQILNSYEELTTREIAVLTTPTFLEYNDPLSFASDVGNFWGVGKEDENNGLIIVVSKKLKNVAIASGYGSEKALSDKYLDSLIHNKLIPEFKKDSFYQGLVNGIEMIKRDWK